MKKETIFSIITSIIVFIILLSGYEYYVYLWALKEQTPVIRVDIFLIYPIILFLSILVFFLSKKMNSIMKSIFILFGVIILTVAGAGMYKFNYLASQDGYDGNKIKDSDFIQENLQFTKNTDVKLADFVQKKFIKDEKAELNISEIDLNNDGTKEIFVEIEGKAFCGTGGCGVLLLERQKDSYKLINDFGTIQGISLVDGKTNGWKNIAFISADGGSAEQYHEMVFQKHIGKYDYLKY